MVSLSNHDTHGMAKLNVRNEIAEGAFIRRMQKLRPVEALLALTLLHEKVIAAAALKGESASAGALEPFLGAAVGLELGHAGGESKGNRGRCKGGKTK